MDLVVHPVPVGIVHLAHQQKAVVPGVADGVLACLAKPLLCLVKILLANLVAELPWQRVGSREGCL